MTTKTVTSISSLLSTANSSVAGDIINLADGAYYIPSRSQLTKADIRVRALNQYKAILTGAPIDPIGSGIIFEGFDLQHDISEQTFINLRGTNCQFINNKVHFANPLTSRQDWIVVRARGCQVNGNEIYQKNNQGNTILVGSGSAFVPDCKILNNRIHDIGGGTQNGAEVIRLGSSEVANQVFNTEIAGNKIERVNTSDAELITVKSSGNKIHDNEIIDCNSSVTLRHGHQNEFKNNKVVNGGLRIYGKDNIITDNQFIRNTRNQLRQFVVGNATVAEDVQGSNAEYSQVRNNTIERNWIINEDASDLILLCFGYGSGGLKPTGNIINNNIITASKGTLANTFDGASWDNNTITNNILFATGTANVGNIPTSGYKLEDPQLVKGIDGYYSLPSVPTPTDIDVRLTALETQYNTLNNRINGIDGNIDTLNNTLASLMDQFNILSNKCDVLGQRLNNIKVSVTA